MGVLIGLFGALAELALVLWDRMADRCERYHRYAVWRASWEDRR